MWRTGSVLMPAVVGVLLAGQALAQDGRWTLRLQAGGLRGSGESFSHRSSLLAPETCGPVETDRCWDIQQYELEDDRPLAGLALSYRLSQHVGVEGAIWRGSMRVRALRQGWASSGVDYRDKWESALDDVGLSGCDLGLVFHLPARNQVDVYGGLLVGWVWPERAHLYGSTREVQDGVEYGGLAGADVALGGGAWRAGLQVRHTATSLQVEESDPLHSDWAEIDARLTAVQLTLGYTF